MTDLWDCLQTTRPIHLEYAGFIKSAAGAFGDAYAYAWSGGPG